MALYSLQTVLWRGMVCLLLAGHWCDIVSSDSPTAVTVSSITTSQITVSVTLPVGVYDGVSVGLVYQGELRSNGSSPVQQITVSSSPRQESFTMSLSAALSPGATYTVRVRSRSGSEFSDYFTVNITVPPALPTAVTVSSITTSQITVNVTLPFGFYDGFSVDFGENSVSEESSLPVQLIVGLPPRQISFTVPLSTALAPGATYTVRVRSRTGSEYSGYFIVTPTITVTPASPTAVTVSSISTSQIKVSVTLPVGVYDGVSVDLMFGGNSVSQGSSSEQQITVSSSPRDESFTVSLSPTLVPGATYTVRVRSRSGSKSSGYFTVTPTSSSTVSPSKPVTESIEEIAQNGRIYVKWKRGTPFGVVNKFVFTRTTVTPNTVAKTTDYDITVQDQANQRENFDLEIPDDTVRGETYTVTVTAVANGVSSEGATFNPLVITPASPTAVTVSSITTSQIKVSVTIPVGLYDGVSVDLMFGGNSVSNGSSEQPSPRQEPFTVPLSPALVPGTTYTVRVRSRSGSKSSGYFTVTPNSTVSPSKPVTESIEEIAQNGRIYVKWKRGSPFGVVNKFVFTRTTVPPNTVAQTTDYDITDQDQASQRENFDLEIPDDTVKGETYTVTVTAVANGVSSEGATFNPLVITPPSPTAVTVSSISTSEIKVSVTLPVGIYNGVSVDLVFGGNSVSQGSSPEQPITVSSSPRDESFTVSLSTALVPGAAYTVRVRSRSGSQYSGYFTVTQTSTVTPSTPTTLTAVSSSADGSIRVTWMGGAGIRSRFYIWLTRETLWEREEETAQQEYTFTSLDSGVYTVTVKAQSGDLNSTDSQPKKVQLDAPPVNVSLNSKTSRSLELAWGRPDLNVQNFRLLVKENKTGACLREIHFNEKDTVPQREKGSCQTSENSQFESSVLNFTYNITGLQPFTSYIIEVYTTSEGASEILVPATLRKITDTEVPSKLNITRVSVGGPRTVTVCWSKPDPFPGPTQYTVTLVDQGEGQREQDRITMVTGYDTDCKYLDHLEEFWLYLIKVSANSSAGTGPEAISEIFRTKESVPGNVTDFGVFTIQNDFWQADVRWNAPALRDRNSNITEFILQYQTNTNGSLGYPMNFTIPWSNTEIVYSQHVVVVPEQAYIFKVTCSSADLLGITYVFPHVAKAGPPAQPEVSLFVIPLGEPKSLTSFPVTLATNFFTDTTNGKIIDYGIVVVKEGSAKDTDPTAYKLPAHFSGEIPNWSEAKKNNFQVAYRASPNNWNFQTEMADKTVREKREAGDQVTFEVGANTSCPEDLDTYCNGPVTLGSKYSVKAFSCTNGGCSETKYVGGYATKAEKTYLVVIVAVVCSAVIVILIVVIIFLVVRSRRQNKAQKSRLDDSSPSPAGSDIALEETPDPTVDYPRSIPIQASDFIDSVDQMHKDSNLEYSNQYGMLRELSPKPPVTAASLEENRIKNRYTDILAFDSTRVKLIPIEDDEASDYINANYISGYNSQREYIASQGPLLSTIEDFWRMIWEQGVSMILMLTNIKENGQDKCELYWPNEAHNEPKQYGDVTVETTSTSTMNSYCLREFNVSVGSSVHRLKHFHFLKWPDFGVSTSDEVVNFIHDFRNYIRPDMTGPLLIHCSAGVGRTGTLIALDQICQQVYDESASLDPTIDIFGIVLTMRHLRPRMVQTEAQYVFIHDAVCEILRDKKRKEDEANHIYGNQNYADDENLYENTGFSSKKEEILYENFSTDQTKTEL